MKKSFIALQNYDNYITKGVVYPSIRIENNRFWFQADNGQEVYISYPITWDHVKEITPEINSLINIL